MNEIMNISYTSYLAGVYLRLSKEDGDLYLDSKYESNSIANQKALILNEMEKMPEVTLVDIYIDDGYSGLNFERPGFQRMLKDVYSGRINMVIVKDLSRFGRDYIETGNYIKKKFPMLNVRFLAILDGYDSLTASASDRNLLLPVKNFVNDNSSRDTSIRIRSHMAVMRKEGLYISAYVAYGYRKSPEDKRKIILDEYASKNVKQIFDWFQAGISILNIVKKLNDMGILSPAEYKRALGIRSYYSFQTYPKAQWSYVAVKRILTNEMYLGRMIQGKTRKINYKLKSVVHVPRDQQDIVEGAVPRIISKEQFDCVQRILNRDTYAPHNREKVYLFSGLVFCAECGKIMIRKNRKKKSVDDVVYMCDTKVKDRECSIHAIRVEELKEIVLTVINQQIRYLEEKEESLKKLESMEMEPMQLIVNDQDIHRKQEELEKCEEQIKSLKKNYGQGVITEEEHLEFQQIYEEKKESLQCEIEAIKKEIEECFEQGITKQRWIEEFKKYKNFTELNRLMLVSLIDKIIVHKNKRIEIIFVYQDECDRMMRILKDVPEVSFEGERQVE